MTHAAFARTNHRPWPLPATPWTWRQSWRDLLFAHWPMPAAALRPLVPAELEIEEFDGASWVGLVPFRMADVALRGLPALPGISAFPEINLRLYVRHGDRPGVWFVSLDATNPLAVWAARKLFHLPYFRAAMQVEAAGEGIRYASRRSCDGTVAFRGRYAPTSAVELAVRGSLEHFLTERYCLYARRADGTLLRTEVHHLPWPLQRAELEIETETVAARQGVATSGPPALLHFSRRLDVVVYPAVRIG